MTQRVDKDTLPLDKPRRTPNHPTKSHIVKTKVDGKEKIIRFGEQGASTAGKPKAGESDRMKAKRASFKARHAANIAKGKSSAAYWADRVKWAEGGAVRNRRAQGTPALDLIEQMRRSASRSEPEVDIASLARTRRQARLPVPPIPPRPPVAPGVLESVPTPVATPQNFPGETANDATPTRNVTYDGNNPLVIAAANAAQRYNIPIPLFLAQIQQESRFDPNARSRVGALGLGQLMPATARELGVDPRDPMQNLDGSARYMRQMLDRFGEVPLALAAYNAGPGRVQRAGNTIPNIRETRNYVSTIMRNAGIPGYAEGGLAELDQKYAEGGAVMAGPMAYDPNQIEALAREVEGGAEPQGYAGGGRVRQGLRAVGRAIRGAPEPEAPTGIRTYHGTPHTFPAERLIRRPDGSLEYIVGGRDRLPEIPAGAELVQDFPLGRFRSDKIGTGEGAQAYSHGHYTAEAEPVARSYRDTLSPGSVLQIDGMPVNSSEWTTATDLLRAGGDVDSYINMLRERALKYRSEMKNNPNLEQIALREINNIEQQIRDAENLRGRTISEVPRGSMYEVRLNVDPNRLLDWDTSLNAQSPELQENVLRAWREGDFARRTGNPEIPREAFMQTEGGGIARMMSEASPVEAAQALREAGIPGLRYLDQGSRGVGQGTRNYVMYDEGLMEILRRYGLLPGAVGAGAAAATGTEGEAREYAEGGEVSSPEDKEYDRRLMERWRQDQGYRVDNPTWPEQRAAIARAGREAADTAAELLLPQSPLDFALMAALGPGGRAVRIPAAAALAAMEPSEAEAGRVRRGLQAAGRAIRGAPEPENLQPLRPTRSASVPSVIEDWQWRPNEKVIADLNLRQIPEHVQEFGEFMRDQVRRADTGDISTRDLQKAFAITRASIQRQAVPADRIRDAGLPLPNVEGRIRPEGAMAEWLGTTMGQRYLDAAGRGSVDEEAIANAMQVMRPFGRHNDIGDALRYGALQLPGRETEARNIISNLYRDPRAINQWRDFGTGLRGIGPSKQGFIGSLLGAGADPTLDARQIILHTGRPTSEAGRFISRRSGLGGNQAVDRLALRQEEMQLPLPRELQPFYQHLTHHAVWDRAGNEVTTHADVMRAMRNYGLLPAGTVGAGAAALREGEAREYARGGKVECGLEGMYRHYYAGGGVDGGDPADNDTSASTAEGQAAAGGVSGAGAGPTGAGAGSPADAGPGPDSGPSGVGGGGMSMADPEGTAAAANMNTAVQAAAMGYGYDPVSGFGGTGLAPAGFYADPTAYGALSAMVRGDITPAQALGYVAQSAIPGATIGTQIDEFGNPSRAANVDFGQMIGTLGGTMAGLATGFGPGAGRVGGMVGSALGQALGYEPGVVSYSPGVYGGPETPDTSGDDYLNYGMQYGFPTPPPSYYNYGPSWVPYYQGIDFR